MLLKGSGIRTRLRKAWHCLAGEPAGRQAPVPNLLGDRDVEWSFVAARIGRYTEARSSVLDFGCDGHGILSWAAASLGARVLAIDLLPIEFTPYYDKIEFRVVDVMHLDKAAEQFDLVINCSTIEHVGLGGRFNSIEDSDGDLHAMRKLCTLLKPGGHMLLTLPVGRDAIIRPLHRIFGQERLPQLTDGYTVLEERFLRKDARNIWLSCTGDEAMQEEGNDHYYALGLMVLRAN